MKRFRAIAIVGAALIAAAAWPDATMKWVEIDLSPRVNGQADVIYQIHWKVSGFDLHGFYFEGFGNAPPVFKYDECRAYGSDGSKFNLSIRQMSGQRYDVILANGAAFRNGEITYSLRYACDLARAGYLGRTKSQFGELVYLNWAPAEWDYSLEHETVMVHYPIAVDGKAVTTQTLAKVNFRTEPFMNNRYSIDYYGQPDDSGRFWLTVRVHAKSLPSKYHMQLQQYISAEAFPLAARGTAQPPVSPRSQLAEEPPHVASRAALPAKTYPLRQPGQFQVRRADQIVAAWHIWIILGLGGFLIALAALVMVRKHVSVARAADSVGQIRWEGNDWVPPRIQVSTFRKEGKIVEDLDNVEIGVLLEVPFGEILTLMVRDLARRGMVEIVSLDPVNLRPTRQPGEITLYDQMLLKSIRPDGTLATAPIQKMFETVVENIQKKGWDCDLEASREHYRQRAAEVFRSMQKDAPQGQDMEEWNRYFSRYDRNDFFWWYYYFTVHDHDHIVGPQDDAVLRNAIGQQTDFGNVSYSQFVASEACHSACYAHSACHDACHSACHDACHSACHDACHSACHSACHDACVSGGAH